MTTPLPPGTPWPLKLAVNLPYEKIPLLRRMCKAEGFTVNEMVEKFLRAYIAGTVKITRNSANADGISVVAMDATNRQHP